jgi:polysaccharide biosynthesis transport protein
MTRTVSNDVSTPRSTRQPHNKDSSEDEFIDIGAFLSALWAGKWSILLLTLCGLFIGVYYAFSVATPIYRSTSVVMMNNRPEQVVDLESVVGGLGVDSSALNSEVEVLRSRNLLGKVVDDLDLTSDPEFNPYLRTSSLSRRLKNHVRGLIKSALGDSAAPVSISAEEEGRRVRNSTIASLLSALSIRNVPQTVVFEISVRSESPTKAASIADTIADIYIRDQVEVKFDATEQATSWLTDRVTQLQGELKQAETAVKDFSASTNLIDQNTLAAMERQVKDIRARIDAADTTYAASLERFDAMQRAITPEEKVGATSDPRLASLLPNIDSPDALSAFNTRFNQILARIQVEMERNNDILVALRQSQKDVSAQIEQQSGDLIQLQQMTREADATRLLYEYFLSRLKETSVQQGIQQADSRLLSQAVVPGVPASPNIPIIIALNTLIGLIIGAALVLIREAMNNSYQTSQMLEAETGYTVLGQLPILPAVRQRKDVLTYLSEKPTSVAAEAIRNLRTSLLLSNIDSPPKIIALSSSLPGEGKTTISMALARNFNMMGKKVLLIEGDIRRRVFAQYINTEKRKGLISVMSGECNFQDAVVREETIGADILLAEKTSANAADLFSSDRFKKLLEDARNQYDIIIIDTPPVLVVPDARIIAQVTDVVVLVVHWNSTRKPQVSEALHMFETVNHPVRGLILNQIKREGSRYYGYGAYTSSRSANKYYTN